MNLIVILDMRHDLLKNEHCDRRPDLLTSFAFPI